MTIDSGISKHHLCHAFQDCMPAKVTFSSRAHGLENLLITEYSRAESPDVFSIPACKDHFIGLITAGASAGSYSINEGRVSPYVLQEGRLIISQAGVSANVWKNQKPATENRAYSFILLQLNPVLLTNLSEDLIDVDGNSIHMSHKMNLEDPLLHQLIVAMKKELINNAPDSKLYCEIAAQIFSVHLLTNYCNKKYIVPNYNDRFPPTYINRIRQCIEENMHREISLQEMASLVHMSLYHFCRTFKKSMGISPHQYVVNLKIEKAKEMMLNTKLSLTDISQSIGYNHSSSFTKAFKNITGISPQEFRKERTATVVMD